MKRFANAVRLFTFVGVVAALAAQTLHAQEKDALYKKIVTIEGITEYRFKNGLRFLSYPDASSPTVTVNMTILVGSRHEGYGETGMAHLLEHMLFKGSKNFPNFDKEVQGHGATDYNGTTWTDRTNYYETLPASDKNLEFGIKLEADRLVNCFMKREDLIKEMTVVRNEFEIGENRPEGILSQRMMAVAFEWHNYGKSTIGNRADIERVPIESLVRFYKKFYQVDNVVLIVAGKFDEKKALQLVSDQFGKLKAPNRVLEKTYTEEPAQDGERNVILRRVGKVPVVGLIYHIPAAAHPDHPACEVLGAILGETPSGRLYKALVEKKKATRISYDVTTWYDPGTMELMAAVNDGTTPEFVRDTLIAESEQFAKSPATKDEVERAVRKYLTLREQRLTKSTSTAIELSEWVGAGDWRLLFIHRDRVAKVTPADVNRVAGKYLRQSNRTVGMFLPSNDVARTPIPQTPDIAKLVNEFKGGKAVSAGEVFNATPENIEKRIRRIKLASGVQVVLFPKKTRGDTVMGTLNLRFGNEKSLAGQNTAVSFLGQMMLRGTKKHSRQEIQDELDKLKSKLSVSSGLGSLTVSWQSKRDKNADLVALIHEVLRQPTFPESELEILKRNFKQTLEKSSVDPQGIAFRTLIRTLQPFPKDSIHYVPTFDESFARLAKVKREDVVKIYEEQVGGTIGEIAIIGDFDPDATVKQLESIFADWQTKTPYTRIKSELVKDVKGSRQTINTPDKENAVYGAALNFAMDDTDPDYAGLEIGNHILGYGFSSRLMDRLRQKEGWSYGCGSQLQVESLDKYSQLIIYALCNPAVIEKVDKGAIEEFDKLLKNGVTEAELKIARNAYLSEMKVQRGSDGPLLGILRSNLRLGRTMQYYADLEKKIASLTVEDVNRALSARLSSGRLVIVRAGDFNKKK